MPVFKRCMGIDQSTKATGIVISEAHAKVEPEIIHDVLIKPKAKWDLYDRQTYMWVNIMRLIEEYGPDLVCIEGYGLNLKNKTALVPLVGLGEVLRYQMRQANIRFISPTPGQNKLFATGNGNADKQKMISTAKMYGYDTNDDNMADALFLSRLGLGVLHSLRVVTAVQMEVLGQLKVV